MKYLIPILRVLVQHHPEQPLNVKQIQAYLPEKVNATTIIATLRFLCKQKIVRMESKIMEHENTYHWLIWMDNVCPLCQQKLSKNHWVDPLF